MTAGLTRGIMGIVERKVADGRTGLKRAEGVEPIHSKNQN